ncbi:MAG TPA: hypothetical protein ENN81_10245, partial [Phycisphaerales bacterium]|nr:hypothetical protein [Phycisphaerales bacterium]
MCKRLLLFGAAMLVVYASGAAIAADVTAPGDVVQGVPNDGDWPGGEVPAMAIDDNVNTKFLHFKGATQPTGIRVTPSAAGSIVDALTFTTANDAVERDPVAFEFYGSNVSIDGPYTLIASGPIVDFAGATAWPRFTKNTTPITFSNKTPYNHYQVLITAVRNPTGANSMQVAEIELLGQVLKAHQPNPANNAIWTAMSASLTWLPGANAAQHHVYFGTNATDVANGTGGTDKGLQADPMYIVVGLTPGTTYYWRIDEVNDLHPDSPWTGDVWTFTVASVKAWDPTPANGAINVVKNSQLTWRAGLGALASYVFMGTSPTNLAQKTIVGGTSYTPTGQADGTTYYWRIDSTDGSTIVTGDVWSYTTIPLIPITDPNLRGWWTFDEGSGSVVLDRSGHGNHGMINGNPTWIDG